MKESCELKENNTLNKTYTPNELNSAQHSTDRSKINYSYEASEDDTTFPESVGKGHNKAPNAANDSNVENVDYETAIAKTGFGKFNFFLLLLAFPATCSSTFDTASLSFVLPTATCELNLTGYDRGLLNGAVYAGMITSSFIWGYLSDSLGRQKLLALGYLCDACCSISSSLSQNKWTLIAFKFLSGFVIAGPFSMMMTYMSEMFGKKYRDSVILSSGIYTSVGGVIQPLIAMAVIPQVFTLELFNGLIRINSWRLFLILSAAPALTSGILTLFCLESPKFLLSKGRKEEALKIFQYMYSKNTGKPPSSYPVKSLKDEQISQGKSSGICNFFSQVSSAFKHPHLKNTFLVCGVQFLALNSLNTIRLWLPQLFFYLQSAGEEEMNTCQAISREMDKQPTTDCDKVTLDQSIYIRVMYANFITAVCMALSSYLVKRTGKKLLIVSSFITSSVLVLSMPWVSTTYIVWVTCLYSGVISAATIGIVGLAVELFPTSIRTLAVSLTMTFGRIGVVIGSITLPFLLSFSCWTPFTTVATFCALCATIIFFAVSGRNSQGEKININIISA